MIRKERVRAVETPPPEFTERHAEMAQIWDCMELCEKIINRHVDAIKQSQAGRDLPRPTIRQMLDGKANNRVSLALLLLDEETKNAAS
jgi:hypothetical protein